MEPEQKLMVIRRWMGRAALALACCAGGSGAALAQADKPPCGSYTVAFYEHGLLYYRDEQGRAFGIDADVIEELGRRSGCDFKPVLESRVRIWDLLTKSALDLSVSAFITPERERFAEILPYMQTRNFVLMRRELAATLATPDAFVAEGQRRVVVVKSFLHGPFFDAWIKRLRTQQRVVEAPDFESAVRIFKSGKVDAMLALDISWALLQRRDHLDEQFSALDWSSPERMPAGLVMSRERVSEADRQRLRLALQSMLKDGSLDAIFKRHVDARLAQSLHLAGSN